MATNKMTLPAAAQPDIEIINQGIFQYRTMQGADYENGSWQTLATAYVGRVTSRVGAEPSEATIHIPLGDATRNIAKRSFDHMVYDARKNEIAPFGPMGSEDGRRATPRDSVTLGTKVRIYSRGQYDAAGWEGLQTNPQANDVKIFVGFVVDMSINEEGNTVSELIIHCKDASWFLQKTYLSGVLFANPLGSTSGGSPGEVTVGVQTVYQRDFEIPFNEGDLPNRYYDPSNAGECDSYPRFVRTDYGRWIADPDFGKMVYCYDAAIDTLTQPHARKWMPGHVWNYISNLLDKEKMTGASRLYNNPSTALTQPYLMPMWTNTKTGQYGGELILPRLSDSGDDQTMWRDLFKPRAAIGATGQTGYATAVSPIGVLSWVGLPILEVLAEILKRNGNYVLARRYDEQDRLVLFPIRTAQALDENKTLPVGILAGGKGISITIPGTNDSKRPSVNNMKLKTSINNYFRRYHFKGGPRWAQVTFSTVAREPWTDDLGQYHAKYQHVNTGGTVVNGQWLPRLTIPCLKPDWTATEQTAFLAAWSTSGDHGGLEAYPKVFRDYVVPADLDLVAFMGKPTTDGFKRFMDRDRATLNALVLKFFETTAGNVFRNRAQRLPICAMRAFRGIRVDTSGNTAHGGPTTESTAANGPKITGYADWFPIRCSWEILTDGRLGIRFDLNGRNNYQFSLQGNTGAANVPTKTCEIWNAVPSSPRAFEIALTIPIQLDEDLYEQVEQPATGATLAKYGPLLEHFRNAGSEYGMEWAVHSFLTRPNPAAGEATGGAVPPVAANGYDDSADRIYVDDRAEVKARANMEANRNSMPDTTGEFTLPFMRFDLEAGTYVNQLRGAGGQPQIDVNTIISSVTQDFQNQQTDIHLDTIL